MSLPYFFVATIAATGEEILLDEDNARHVIQALRMSAGEKILIADGKGSTAEAEITDAHKKKPRVRILQTFFQQRPGTESVIAISLVKNASRFEWFLEKATELGITYIIPMICARTEKQQGRLDRFANIIISAMLQSKQVWLPALADPMPFKDVVAHSQQARKFIAHCADGEKTQLSDALGSGSGSRIILIGPEGDFSPDEIQLASQSGFHSVSLGVTRLRTETAGMVAATLFTQL